MSRCQTAACHADAVTVVDGWSLCAEHAAPEQPDRERSWHAYETRQQWIARLHHAGLTDTQIAGVVGVSPCTARDARRRLGLPVNRTEKQLARDERLAREADARVRKCACDRWCWDGVCRSCDVEVAS